MRGERCKRSPSARSEATRVLAAPAIELGAPAGCFDGLVRFDDFEMQCNGGACRTGNHRNGTEWRGGKLMSSSRARAEQCGYLAQGTQRKCPLCDARGILFGAAHKSSALPHPALSLPLRGPERESKRRTGSLATVRRREPRSGEGACRTCQYFGTAGVCRAVSSDLRRRNERCWSEICVAEAE